MRIKIRPFDHQFAAKKGELRAATLGLDWMHFPRDTSGIHTRERAVETFCRPCQNGALCGFASSCHRWGVIHYTFIYRFLSSKSAAITYTTRYTKAHYWYSGTRGFFLLLFEAGSFYSDKFATIALTQNGENRDGGDPRRRKHNRLYSLRVRV